MAIACSRKVRKPNNMTQTRGLFQSHDEIGFRLSRVVPTASFQTRWCLFVAPMWRCFTLVWALNLLPFSVSRIITHLDALDGFYPPNEPDIPEITGAFTVTVIARFDNLAAGWYQRLFDFGDGPDTNNIFLGQEGAGNNMLFVHRTGATTPFCSTSVSGAITEGTTDTWEAAIDVNGQVTLKKNGDILSSTDSCAGLVPLANETRSSKLLGKSNWVADTDLMGAILGLKVVNHGETVSPIKSMEMLNLPGQVFGKYFVASLYARFDNLSTGREYQRFFGFGNGQQTSILAFAQIAATKDVYLELWQQNPVSGMADDIFQCKTNETVLVQGEMALWRVEMIAGKFRIEKNGQLLKECDYPTAPAPEAVYRQNLFVGESNWSSDAKTQGVILGLRVDMRDFTS